LSNMITSSGVDRQGAIPNAALADYHSHAWKITVGVVIHQICLTDRKGQKLPPIPAKAG
jgi:hypothetical protein